MNKLILWAKALISSNSICPLPEGQGQLMISNFEERKHERNYKAAELFTICDALKERINEFGRCVG